MPFFGEVVFAGTAAQYNNALPQCGACGLYRTCNSPKMQPSGNGRKKIMLIAEAPGETEDERGTQLVGRTGQYLASKLFDWAGIDLRRDCILHNAVICRPHTKDGKNRAPTEKELDYCLPNVKQAIAKYKPRVIVPIGHCALRSVLQGIWTSAVKDVGRWVGWQIPCQELNAWICPIYHPSYILRERDATKGRTVVEVLYKQHLKAIGELTERPWKVVPNYKRGVEVLLDEHQVISALRKFTHRGGPIAFDYETTMLKPDAKDARIVAASVCWRGKRTIAFPFGGRDVRNAFRELITAGHPLISQNLKFEDRWSRVKLGVTPTKWVWDTMNQGHVVDNRRGCTGLDFQALVYLGFGSWDAHINSYLVADGSYTKNNVHKVDFTTLCLYCGIDSLVTYKIAVEQRKRLRMSPL